MAENTSISTYQYHTEPTNVTINFPENLNEEDEDEELNNPSYPLVQQQQQPSILYNFNNGHQHLSLPVSSTTHQPQFDLLLDEGEDDGEQTSTLLLNLTPPTPVPIQRVSSEDEFNL